MLIMCKCFACEVSFFYQDCVIYLNNRYICKC